MVNRKRFDCFSFVIFCIRILFSPRRIRFLVVLFLVAGSFFVARLNAQSVYPELDLPERVSGLQDLYIQLDEINKWRSVEFHERDWFLVGRILYSCFQERKTIMDNYLNCLPKEAFTSVRTVVESALQKEVQQPHNEVLNISYAETREILRIIFATKPSLDAKLNDWKETPPTLEDCIKTVLEGLKHYEALQRKTKVVSLLLSRPDWMLSALEFDKSKWQNELERYNKLIDINSSIAVYSLADALKSFEQISNVWASSEFAAFESHLSKEVSRLNGWFQQNKQHLESAVRDIKNVAPKYVDLPGGNSFLRLRIETAGKTAEGLVATVSASICSNKQVKAENWNSDQVLTQEIPLGLEVYGVSLVNPSHPQILKTHLVTNQRVDPILLRNALDKMGFPEKVTISPDLRVSSDFRSIDLLYTARIGSIEFAKNLWFKLWPNPSSDLSRTLDVLVDSLQTSFNREVNGKKFLVGSTGIEIQGLKTVGDWKQQDFSFVATTNIQDLGTVVIPISLIRKGTTFQLKPDVHFLSNSAVEQLRNKIEQSALNTAELKSVANYISINGTVFDPNSESYKGTVKIDVASSEFPPTIFPFSFSPSSGLTTDISSIRNQCLNLIEGIKRKMVAKAISSAREQLLGKSLELFGAGKFDVTGIPSETDPVIIDGTLTLTGTAEKVAVTGIHVLELTNSAGQFAPRLSFEKAVINSVDAELLGKRLLKSAGLPDEVCNLMLKGTVPDGIVLHVQLNIKGINTPLDLGDVVIANSGLRIDPSLESRLTTALEHLAGNISVSQIGIIEDVKFSGSITSGLKVKATGKVKLQQISLDTEVEIYPAIKILKPTENDAYSALTSAVLQSLMPALSQAGLTVTNLKIVLNPLRIRFDVALNVLSSVSLPIPSVELSQDGIHFSASVITIPILIPPTIVVGPGQIIRPSISLNLENGDLSVNGILIITAAPEQIVKLPATVSMHVSKDSLAASFEGSLIILNFLKLFEANGSVDLSKVVMSLNAHSSEEVNKIGIKFNACLFADGKNGHFNVDGSLTVLGFNISKCNIRVEANGQSVTLFVSVSHDIPLGKADLTFHSSDFSDFAAQGNVKFAGMDFSLLIESAFAKAEFDALGFHITVIVPSISGLTPDLINNILNALKNPSIDLNNLLNRNIVVNLVKPGNGDGVPSNGIRSDLPAAKSPTAHGTGQPPRDVGGGISQTQAAGDEEKVVGPQMIPRLLSTASGMKNNRFGVTNDGSPGVVMVNEAKAFFNKAGLFEITRFVRWEGRDTVNFYSILADSNTRKFVLVRVYPTYELRELSIELTAWGLNDNDFWSWLPNGGSGFLMDFTLQAMFIAYSHAKLSSQDILYVNHIDSENQRIFYMAVRIPSNEIVLIYTLPPHVVPPNPDPDWLRFLIQYEDPERSHILEVENSASPLLKKYLFWRSNPCLSPRVCEGGALFLKKTSDGKVLAYSVVSSKESLTAISADKVQNVSAFYRPGANYACLALYDPSNEIVLHLLAEHWEKAYIACGKEVSLIVLSSGIETTNDWQLGIISKTDQLAHFQNLSGSVLSTRYDQWSAENNVKSGSPLDLHSKENRERFLELITERDTWDSYFRSNPFGLFLSDSQ